MLFAMRYVDVDLLDEERRLRSDFLSPPRGDRARRAFLKESPMPSGTVKWFNPQKGYGFIQPSDGGRDVFVHISAVEKAGMATLTEGQKISYDVITTDRGRTAAGNLKAG
jgi:CspA family cold shock protein